MTTSLLCSCAGSPDDSLGPGDTPALLPPSCLPPVWQGPTLWLKTAERHPTNLYAYGLGETIRFALKLRQKLCMAGISCGMTFAPEVLNGQLMDGDRPAC